MALHIGVILWLTKVPNVGHLSLELSDGFYISFSPEEHSGWKESCWGNTIGEDIRTKGPLENVLYLPLGIVDQEEIKRWWRRVMGDKDEYNRYKLVLTNCSSVVKEALRKGGIYEDPVLEGVGAVSRPIDTPWDVFQWAKHTRYKFAERSQYSTDDIMVADIEVILWLPKVPNVGHLSLELSDGFYISFWPEKQSRWKKTCRGNTYQDDLRAEGRRPDEVLYLPPGIVDQEKIKRWWNRVMNDKEYNLVLNNCSSVVREALRKGEIYEDPVLRGVDTVSRPIDTPSAVYSWAGVCKDLYLGKRGTALVRHVFEPTKNDVRSLWNWIPGLD